MFGLVFFFLSEFIYSVFFPIVICAIFTPRQLHIAQLVVFIVSSGKIKHPSNWNSSDWFQPGRRLRVNSADDGNSVQKSVNLKRKCWFSRQRLDEDCNSCKNKMIISWRNYEINEKISSPEKKCTRLTSVEDWDNLHKYTDESEASSKSEMLISQQRKLKNFKQRTWYCRQKKKEWKFSMWKLRNRIKLILFSMLIICSTCGANLYLNIFFISLLGVSFLGSFFISKTKRA